MPVFRILEVNGVSCLEAVLVDESVRYEPGIIRGMHGSFQVSKPTPTMKTYYRGAAAGEPETKPRCHGTGTLTFQPSLASFHVMESTAEKLVLGDGAFWACGAGLEIESLAHDGVSPVKMTTLEGTGSFVVRSPGQIEKICLEDDELQVDAAALVVRSASLSALAAKSARVDLRRQLYEETRLITLAGTGSAWVCWTPNPLTMLQDEMSALRQKRRP